MGVRLYSPVLGRFLQTDPVPGGSANAYDYAFQDPINGRDLDGRDARDDRWHKILRAYMSSALDNYNRFVKNVRGNSCVMFVFFCRPKYDKATRDGLIRTAHAAVLQFAAQLGMEYWGQFDDEYAFDRYAHFYGMWQTTGGQLAVGIGEYGLVAGFESGLNGVFNKILKKYR